MCVCVCVSVGRGEHIYGGVTLFGMFIGLLIWVRIFRGSLYMGEHINRILQYLFWKKQDINVKVFNVITNKNEANTMTKYISCDCNYKLNSTTCNSNQKWNKKTWTITITCICQNSKNLKSIADTSVITCDEIISVNCIWSKYEMLMLIISLSQN